MLDEASTHILSDSTRKSSAVSRQCHMSVYAVLQIALHSTYVQSLLCSLQVLNATAIGFHVTQVCFA